MWILFFKEDTQSCGYANTKISMEAMFRSSLPQVVCRRTGVFCFVCLFVVSNILLLVFCVVCFGCVSPMSCVLCPVFCVMCPVCSVVPVSLDGPLLIALSGFADVYYLDKHHTFSYCLVCEFSHKLVKYYSFICCVLFVCPYSRQLDKHCAF